MEIKVRSDRGVWQEADTYQIQAYELFKSHNSDEIIHNNHSVVTVIKKIDGKTYLVKANGDKQPICDWNNVKVFLTDQNPVNWYPARNYQIWTYFDFLYDENNLSEKKYYTRGSNPIYYNSNYIQIPLNFMEPNIIFKMIRNEHNRIYYVRNDMYRSMVRISDNEKERMGYLGFYNRMNLPLHPIEILPYSSVETPKIIIPDTINITTYNDADMCIICNNYKKNVQFRPCNHDSVCSYCAKQILDKKKKLECPVCRGIVTNVEKIKVNNKSIN